MPDIPTTPLLGRRALLGAGLGAGLLALSGCSSDSPADGPSATPAEPDLAPDVAVATTALTRVRAVRQAVEATIEAFPALRVEIGGVLAMHETHEAALVDAVPKRALTTATPTAYAVPRRLPQAASRLADAERGLHDQLGTLAVSAQSGDFARLLAAMGAGVGQRLARWPS